MKTNSSVDNLHFEMTDLEDQSLSIFSWQGWSLWVFKCFLAFCGLICIIGRFLIIHYIQKYAPKQRPINRMILVDQVCKFIAFA